MKSLLTMVAAMALTAAFANAAMAQSASKDKQIAQAISALPASMRAGAMVISYDAKGNAEVLRQGNNGIFCTPNTNPDGFAVSCRGMALKAASDFSAKKKSEGKDARSISADTNAAYESGTLKRAPMGTMIYNRRGKTEADSRSLWVVLMPNANAAQLGLPTTRVNASSPWMMRSGTVGAHIMMPQTASMDDMPPPPRTM